MIALLAVMAGGALGAGLRYGAHQWLDRPGGFPVAVLTVNAVGSFLIGLIAMLILTRPALAPWRPFLVTGLLGGLTTFSTFSLDAVLLTQRGDALSAMVYVFGALGLGLGGVLLGQTIGRAL